MLKWIIDNLDFLVIFAIIGAVLHFLHLVFERRSETQPPPQQAETALPPPAPEKKTIEYPPMVDGKQVAYQYKNVDVQTPPHLKPETLLAEPVTFSEDQDRILVSVKGTPIGTLAHTRIAGMVSDWLSKKDPVLGYVTSADNAAHTLRVFIVFYRDQIAWYLRKNPDAKKYRLVGNKSDEMQLNLIGLQPGTACDIQYDMGKGKYIVSYADLEIGCLPSAAAKLFDGEDPEFANVFIADVETDEDDKTVVYVYVFE